MQRLRRQGREGTRRRGRALDRPPLVSLERHVADTFRILTIQKSASGHGQALRQRKCSTDCLYKYSSEGMTMERACCNFKFCAAM